MTLGKNLKRQAKSNAGLLRKKLDNARENYGYRPEVLTITYAWLEVITDILKKVGK